MKSSYELAMERLNQTAPTMKLSDEKKKRLADLESRYKAKLAEREIFLKAEIAKATSQGDQKALTQLEKQWASDRKSLEVELEEKKEQVRADQAPPGSAAG